MGALGNPRRMPHVAATIDYLRHCGADKIVVTQTKRVRVAWRYDGQRLSITFAAATRRTDEIANTARQLVRRQYRTIGVEVSA